MPRSISLLALSIFLGVRGMVVVADKTAELYETTFWASYNIPCVFFLCHALPHANSPL